MVKPVTRDWHDREENRASGLIVGAVAGILLGVLATWLPGCGDNGSGPSGNDGLISQGWVKFERGQFEAALSTFEEAAGGEGDRAEACNGMGWCYMKIDSLRAGLDAFDQALSEGLSSADPHAGKALIYRDITPANFQNAIDWAYEALRKDAHYVFSHDTSLDWKDLRRVRAQSYFALARYLSAKFEVDILNPENHLNPGSATFVEDLLAEIQRLGETI
jgi:tetratricopeptide (TPR) repeat protein